MFVNVVMCIGKLKFFCDVGDVEMVFFVVGEFFIEFVVFYVIGIECCELVVDGECLVDVFYFVGDSGSVFVCFVVEI